MTIQKYKFALANDERGTTAIIFAVSLIPLMGIVGAAVDGTRWLTAKRSTQTAIDAAVLAGARAMQLSPENEAPALETASRIYTVNIAGRIGVENDTVTFETADHKSAVTVKGNAYLKTTFLSVVGIKQLPLVPQAAGQLPKAAYASGRNQASNVEVALILDFTGSMCNDGNGPCTSGTKVQALRDAATDFVNIVVQDDQSAYKSRVALVPFSTRIRVDVDNHDGTMMRKLTNLNSSWSGWYKSCVASSGSGSGETSGSWTCTQTQTTYKQDWRPIPCVAERAYGYWSPSTSDISYSDDEPTSGKWLTAHEGTRSPSFIDSSDTLVQTTSDNGTSAATPSTNWNYDVAGRGCGDVAESNRVMPLSSNKTALKNRIAAFSAAGSTGGVAGIAWGWYLMSPKWKYIWTGDAEPGTYEDVTTRQENGAAKLRKVAVLMTDGVFNTLRSGKDQSTTMVATHAKNICQAMKDQGIEIYSVGFSLDLLSSSDRTVAEDMLKSCGTDLAHFYSSLSVNDLKQAFRDIALKVTPIRLTQ